MTYPVTLWNDQDLCQICQPCLAEKVNKVKAILRMETGEPPYLDINRCYDCRLCIRACLFEAVRLGGNVVSYNERPAGFGLG